MVLTRCTTAHFASTRVSELTQFCIRGSLVGCNPSSSCRVHQYYALSSTVLRASCWQDLLWSGRTTWFEFTPAAHFDDTLAARVARLETSLNCNRTPLCAPGRKRGGAPAAGVRSSTMCSGNVRTLKFFTIIKIDFVCATAIGRYQ